jgi:hypothetical protein
VSPLCSPAPLQSDAEVLTPTTDALASFFAARTAHLTDAIFDDGDPTLTSRRDAAHAVSHGAQATPSIRAALPSPNQPDPDRVGPESPHSREGFERALYENAVDLTETVADVAYDLDLHCLRKRNLRWSPDDDDGDNEDNERLSAPVSHLDIDLGTRAVRAALPYAVRLELPAGAAGTATMQVVRHKSRNMFVLAVDERVQIDEFAGGDEDALLIFWASPTSPGQSACAILDIDVDGSSLRICINMTGCLPLFNVLPESSNPDHNSSKPVVPTPRNATDISFGVAGPGCDESIVDVDRVVTILNQTDDGAPLLVQIALADNADGKFAIAPGPELETRQFLLAKLDGDAEYSFVVRCSQSRSSAPDCGDSDAELLGHILISLPTFVAKPTSSDVDLDLLHHFDFVVNLIRPSQKVLHQDSDLPTIIEVLDPEVERSHSSIADDNDDYVDDDNDKCRDLFFLEDTSPLAVDIKSEIKSFNFSESLHSSNLQGIDLFASPFEGALSPTAVQSPPQCSKPLTNRHGQPRLQFEKSIVVNNGIFIESTEREKHFSVRNDSTVPLRVFVSVSERAKAEIYIVQHKESQDMLSPGERLALNVGRNSPNGANCSLYIWCIAGIETDPVDIMKAGHVQEGCCLYKIPFNMDPTTPQPRQST